MLAADEDRVGQARILLEGIGSLAGTNLAATLEAMKRELSALYTGVELFRSGRTSYGSGHEAVAAFWWKVRAALDLGTPVIDVLDGLEKDTSVLRTVLQRERQRLAEPEPKAEPEAEPATKPKANNRPTNVNVRMLDELSKNADCRGWTITQWADYLDVSGASVCYAPTWKELQKHRKDAKTGRKADRRGRGIGRRKEEAEEDD